MRQLDLFGDLFSNEPAVSKSSRNIGAPVTEEEPIQVDEETLTVARGEVISTPGTILHEPDAENDFEVHAVFETEQPALIDEAEFFPAANITELVTEQTPQSVIYSDGIIKVKLKAKPLVKKEEQVERTEGDILQQKRGRKSYKECDAEADLIEIPGDEELFQKQYYPISEVAKWFRVNTSLLRYWSNEFSALKPRKNRKGDRLFRPEDVKTLQLIYQLLRVRKYSIEGAKEYLRVSKQKGDVQLQLTQTLLKFKGFLLELKANL